MEERRPKPPTHTLKVKERDGKGYHNVVGVGWLNDGGSLTISLRPCVVLSWNDKVHITLFPKGDEHGN